ncbi:MAG: mucin [Gammaproteobacteria bacterium (ex Lamellibrachia satsuma)]|nr:MAG: GldG family protein [Gammaproteobacteria bacterium (ex Lamellibrachia satsuma)]RRS30750.1 MAG: mucin [Gammaproteobacteria bacterium (ex Lamellibrachia satsuma)]RRS36833.1 MAG: mucin [Gammaproteobacteria bacterium (ex Lamellibrachia satsuma)]
MKIPSPFQNTLFYLQLLAVLLLTAWLSSRFELQWDWTRNGSNTLSKTSIETLAHAEGPITITVYAAKQPALREKVESFIERYHRFKPDLTLKFIDPIQHPGAARRQGITLSGELLIDYRGRQERLQQLDEITLTNAIHRLLRTETHWLVGLEGHGERSLLGEANHDLGLFGSALQQKGIKTISLNLVDTPDIPDNTSLLVVASPQKTLLQAELSRLQLYLEQGGNLLLLLDPGQDTVLSPLLASLGLETLPGILVDANVRELGIDDPSIALVSQYSPHPVTRDFNLITLYPQALALQSSVSSPWHVVPLLQTLQNSWNETGAIQGEIQRNPEAGEMPGPLTIGYAMSREKNSGTQRVIVVGDGDFLSNAYLGNAGNQDLGITLINWLTAEENLDIQSHQATDKTLLLSPLAQGIIGLGFLILLPLLLLATGGLIHWGRKRA